MCQTIISGDNMKLIIERNTNEKINRSKEIIKKEKQKIKAEKKKQKQEKRNNYNYKRIQGCRLQKDRC